MLTGANVDYEELLSLNLNGHIAYVYSTMLACTQVLATGPATRDGKTYIGKTRDLKSGPLLQVLLHREFDDGSFLNEIQTAGRMTIPDGSTSTASRCRVVGNGRRASRSISRVPTKPGSRSTCSRFCARRAAPRKHCA
ncbi:MAG: hypothetical protein LC797_09165 [Chloroflexi bacterium]|nr:hypothetical protein [Chloroflexota bacterium]